MSHKLSRDRLLDEMGLSPRWVLRQSARAEPVACARSVEPVESVVSVESVEPVGPGAPASDESVSPARRAAADVAPTMPVEGPGDAVERSGRIAQLDWDALRESIAGCTACPLYRQRRQAVAGVGDENADWLFIGEGPGAEEDARGEPFVGAAGKLLDAMLAAIGLERGSDVYIANAVKCRPPGNRTPEAAEIAACGPYLARQIALSRPRLIVLLGRAAVQAVLGEERSLASLRGRPLAYRDGQREIPVIVTYHPAYLLRNLPDKAKAWEDLCRARALMRTLKEA